MAGNSREPVIKYEPAEALFQDLRSRNNDVRLKAAEDLRGVMETLQRETSSNPSEYNEILQDVVARATSCINFGQDSAERIGGIYAISALTDFKVEDASARMTRFANTLRSVLRGTDTTSMLAASQALGKLTAAGSPLTQEIVDAEIKSALEALQVERQENRRFAAVLTVKELASNAPVNVYQYIKDLLQVIWVPLRDPKILIRQQAAQALGVLLEIIVQRVADLRDQWLIRLYQEIHKGFQLNTADTIHGSLLSLKELLMRGALFMKGGTRYEESCERVFLFKEHREAQVRQEVVTLIPILAAYDPDVFAAHHLHRFMMHLQGQLKKDKDRNGAFEAIGEVAYAVGNSINPYLDGILVYLREGLSMKARNKAMNEAPLFKCISLISIAVGQTLTKYMDALLDPIFACGLSDALTQALVDMAHFIPPAKPGIQEKLLDLLSEVLCGRPFAPLGTPSHAIPTSQPVRDLKDPVQLERREAEIALALQTLGSFDFSGKLYRSWVYMNNIRTSVVTHWEIITRSDPIPGHILNEFVRDVIVQYVDDEKQNIRKAAALTCCQLFVKDPIVHQVSRHAIQVVGTVIEKLLAVSVADPDDEIRLTVLTSLSSRFDKHLAKAENIRILFLALNDERFPNRQAAMRIIGRLSAVNPAFVFPSLRKVLVQLLTEIEFSNVPRKKQESAQLISDLVMSASKLLKPYVDPIVQVILPKASDVDEKVAATSLKAIGDLATVGGEAMVPYIPKLMQLILRNLQDLSNSAKRSAALRTLGQLSSNSGYVIQPYVDYPELLTLLMNTVKNEAPGNLRRETIRVIGILGALDPYRHQQVIEQSPEGNLAADAAHVTDVSLVISGTSPSSDEYYPTVVITTLMQLLKDHSLMQYHQAVLDAVMNIYKTMGMKCVPYLGQTIPGFISVMTDTPHIRVEGIFSQLSTLVRIVKMHIRPFLPQILDTVQIFWQTHKSAHGTMLMLIESIARSLEGDFKIYLARVLPLMLGVLDEDRTQRREPSVKVLHAFLVFGPSAEEYMHLIVPVIVKMFDRPGQPQGVRKLAIDTLAQMCRQVNLSEFASKIIHPLCRVISNGDTTLRQAAIDTICALVFQLGPEFLPFIPTVSRYMTLNRVSHSNYQKIVTALQRGEPLPQDLNSGRSFGMVTDEPDLSEISTKPLPVNQEHLKSAWQASQRTTREDWIEWLRRLSIELLKESPHQALRACFPLASVHVPTARALFNSAFISCYTLLYDNFQKDLVTNIEIALTSPHIPPEILQTLLNLAEFMMHDDKSLPIDVRTLGTYAGKCHAYAKALHYKELEFNADQSPSATAALISINNQLQQTDAAFGILRKAQAYGELDVKETWFEKLNRWEDALASYQRRENEEENPGFDIIMGKMRCLHALGEWDILSSLAEEKWARSSAEGHQRAIAPLAAAAAWGLGRWEHMDKYLNAMKPFSPDRSFFGAILSIHRDQFDEARLHIERVRDGLDTELSALLGESYNRAYSVIVRVQMLSELEEIITYKQSKGDKEKQALMRNTWNTRLKGCQRNVEDWQRILKVRALVVRPEENMEMWIKFANLCRKQQRFGLAEKSLRSLVGANQSLFDIPLQGHAPHQVNYAILKYMWAVPGTHKPSDALDKMVEFTSRLSRAIEEGVRELSSGGGVQQNTVNGLNSSFAQMSFDNSGPNGARSEDRKDPVTPRLLEEWQKLLARCHLKQGQWQTALHKSTWDHDDVHSILKSYTAATQYDSKWYKAWHAWALANFEVVQSLSADPTSEAADMAPGIIEHHVVPAIQGFFRSIDLISTSSLQDTLRLLTLWFAHGSHQDVHHMITSGISTVTVDTWLEVIPQLIARINQPSQRVRKAVETLLCEVGKVHPQALVYPLTVSIKSESQQRFRPAQNIMNHLRGHSPRLVEQAELVSTELIRIAVLWHELWHEALEEASRMYFGENNIPAMMNILEPLHQMIERGPETLREISFVQAFARDLHEAHEWCKTWERTNDPGDLNAAWDVYYQIFKKISRQISQVSTLDLQYVSPKLKAVRDLELAVPGTYQSGKPVIRIVSFDPTAHVINSKQRPRRISLYGSDGVEHVYLLKGHEDIRQDERVMQLFGLCNTLLSNDSECLKRHLNIQRYSIIPLSTSSGLLGWVPNSDTLHVLIKEYREKRGILLNIENRIMLQMAPDYDNLTLMQKVEVFSYAMDNTTGQDLYRVLWLKSRSSEAWLERRTNYIRSLATMSMVGYILGLGDRHPSNLMMDRTTGKIIHIDFGDCFEIAMHREKYPERVPFRLTRMLTYAMEVSNIEGSFRTTTENVMRVLRDNKESLMAVLEAFIHDPLLTWRLDHRESPKETAFPSERRQSLMGLPTDGNNNGQFPPIGSLRQMGHSLMGRPRTRSSATGTRPSNLTNGAGAGAGAGSVANHGVFEPEGKEVQNARALQVLSRVREKLTGTEFRPGVELNVEDQVDKLISQATDVENLCQHYIGWCSFW